MTFNGGNSLSDTLVTLDSLARTRVSQKRQGPNATQFDSVETDYDANGRAYRVSVPYSAAENATAPSGTAFTTTLFDGLGRTSTVTDGGNGVTNYTYADNDVLVQVSPAPSNENIKQRRLEYDALGRLTSVCEITSAAGSGTCGQKNAATGYWTQYSFDATGALAKVTQNAQSNSLYNAQTRTLTHDGLGRELSEQNPETGLWTFAYDKDSKCTGSYPGDQVRTTDAVGNVTCYAYDALHRNTSVTYPSGQYSGVTQPKTFVYDASTASGFTLANTLGKLAEAYTGSASAKVTDLVFSYSVRGETTDVWEKTPHSGTAQNPY